MAEPAAVAVTASPPSPTGPTGRLIDLRNLYWVGAVLVAMVAVIGYGNIWHLNFLHVISGILWTGIDLFMGFVVGPILRKVELPVRREIITRLMPKMLFLMPTLSIVTTTAGWYLARRLGYLDLPWPQFWWVAAALAVVTVLTVQGIGILLPTNLAVLLQLRKPEPDYARIGRWMRIYVWVVASQGVLQVAIVVIMARFATGI